MSRRYRGRHRRRSLRAVATVALALLTLLGLTLPGAYGGYVAKITNNNNAAGTATYFTCTTAQGGTTPQAYFTFPFGDASGALGATDISGNGRTGSYSATGVTYGQANGGTCPRDNRTVIKVDGAAGYVTYPTLLPMAAPAVFSIEIWFKTLSPQGKLIGFGNQRTTASTVNDRHMYIDSTGRLVFGVFPTTVKTLSSPAATPVTDNKWHQAVGTLSTLGMFLYLDGVQVGSNTAVTSDEANTGFWKIGWDTLAGWPNAPASNYFNGNLAFASVYTSALTATQVAQHYRAGT